MTAYITVDDGDDSPRLAIALASLLRCGTPVVVIRPYDETSAYAVPTISGRHLTVRIIGHDTDLAIVPTSWEQHEPWHEGIELLDGEVVDTVCLLPIHRGAMAIARWALDQPQSSAVSVLRDTPESDELG